MSRDRLHRVGGRWVELPNAPVPVARPADSASKAEWVAYAEAVGVDSSGTRAQIVARFADELVEPVDGGAQVDAVTLGDEGSAQVEELAAGEPGSDLLDENADVFGHEDKG